MRPNHSTRFAFVIALAVAGSSAFAAAPVGKQLASVDTDHKQRGGVSTRSPFAVDSSLGTLGVGSHAFSGTTVGATNDIDTYGSAFNNAAIWDQDYIYSFTLAAPQNVSVTFNDPDAATTDNDFFIIPLNDVTTNVNGLREAEPLAVELYTGTANYGILPAGTYYASIDAWRGNPTAAGTPATGRATAFSGSIDVTAAPAALYTGELDAGDGTFNRPTTTTSLSAVGTDVSYESHAIHVDAAGTYSLNQISSFDDFLALYQGSFDPSNPLANLVAVDDDGGDGNDSLISFALTPGVQYYLVDTSFDNAEFGPYTLSASGPGNVLLGNVPEPTTLAAIGLAGALVGRRRR